MFKLILISGLFCAANALWDDTNSRLDDLVRVPIHRHGRPLVAKNPVVQNRHGLQFSSDQSSNLQSQAQSSSSGNSDLKGILKQLLSSQPSGQKSGGSITGLIYKAIFKNLINNEF